jgi:hypothetical protein
LTNLFRSYAAWKPDSTNLKLNRLYIIFFCFESLQRDVLNVAEKGNDTHLQRMSQETKLTGRQSVYEQEQRPNKQNFKKVYNLSKDIGKVV